MSPAVHETVPERIELAINASLLDILPVRLSCSDGEIERSSLTPLVCRAEQQQDVTIAKAHALLLKLNVRRVDLRRLVDDSIMRS